MRYGQVLITRPLEESRELADRLAQDGMQAIILPAHDFSPLGLGADEVRRLQKAAAGAAPALLIFTSPRSVEFGLGQVPPLVLQDAEIAAIGPGTAFRLQAAGIRVHLKPLTGYTSETLLEDMSARRQAGARDGGSAFLLAAPGGRTRLKEGLTELGFETHFLMVYERKAAALAADAIEQIERSASLLAIWTSAGAIDSMHRRLPATCWYRLCRAEWLVISDRLRRIARAYSPKAIHLAAGPSNRDIHAAVQALAAD